MFIRFFEALVLVASLLLVVTQIFIPALRGRMLFPLFRKASVLEKELAEVYQVKYEAEIEEKIEEVKHEVEEAVKKRKPRVAKPKQPKEEK